MVSQEKREEDERLREELRRVTAAKLKKVINPLIKRSEEKKAPNPRQRTERLQTNARLAVCVLL